MAENNNEIEELKKRIEKLETQMIYLSRQLGISTQEPPKWTASPTVIAFLRKGDKLGAIRAFREETGAGLKDAKNFIESLQLK